MIARFTAELVKTGAAMVYAAAVPITAGFTVAYLTNMSPAAGIAATAVLTACALATAWTRWNGTPTAIALALALGLLGATGWRTAASEDLPPLPLTLLVVAITAGAMIAATPGVVRRLPYLRTRYHR